MTLVEMALKTIDALFHVCAPLGIGPGMGTTKSLRRLGLSSARGLPTMFRRRLPTMERHRARGEPLADFLHRRPLGRLFLEAVEDEALEVFGNFLVCPLR